MVIPTPTIGRHSRAERFQGSKTLGASRDPRVARDAQPWAKLCNAVGVQTWAKFGRDQKCLTGVSLRIEPPAHVGGSLFQRNTRFVPSPEARNFAIDFMAS
jgi:hypothetical protein